MTKNEFLAYIAGFLDGEGSISLKKERGRWVLPAIQIRNVYPEPLQKIQKVFGGSLYLRKGEKEKWRDTFEWEITRWKGCLNLLEKIYPYLIIKKKQAAIIIRLAKKVQMKPYHSFPLAKNEQQEREEAYKEIRILNKRGN